MKQRPLEIHKVKQAISSTTGDAQLLIALCFYTGRRIGDVVSLRSSDIKDNRISFIEGKTGKPASIAINPELMKLLVKRLDREYIFPSRVKGNHITKQWANRLIKKSLGDAVSSHALRKTVATFLYDQTKDVLLVMNFLNHSSPSTTLAYIGVDTTKIDHVLNKI
jgi:integrase